MASQHDENIDFDSSFEVVEDEQFEKVESVDDTKSESFQFVSISGQKTKAIDIETYEDSIPILTSIVGKWKPISCENLEDYFKMHNMTELSELAWQHGEVCYEMKGGMLHVHTQLLNKPLSASVFKLQNPVENGISSVICYVEKNILKTVCTNPSDGKETWRVERFVKNGRLVIKNTYGEFKCERIYQRVN